MGVGGRDEDRANVKRRGRREKKKKREILNKR